RSGLRARCGRDRSQLVRAVLVTGAAGLIGSHLCEAFAQAGWKVRALDKPGSDCAAARLAGAAVSAVELGQPEGALAAAELASGVRLIAHAAYPGPNEIFEALASARAAMAAAPSGCRGAARWCIPCMPRAWPRQRC